MAVEVRIIYHLPESQQFHIYIPLCFYFNGCVPVLFWIRYQFTFHYASTLTDPDVHLILFDCAIYIPLCFYFNVGGWMGARAGTAFTFHYASTLTSSSCSILSSLFCIYIPLCFYFNISQRKQKSIPKSIYIPLCFYFNRRNKTNPSPWLFIYIPLCFYFNQNQGIWNASGVRFTFHYASTLTVIRDDFFGRRLDLHSTMLLL